MVIEYEGNLTFEPCFSNRSSTICDKAHFQWVQRWNKGHKKSKSLNPKYNACLPFLMTGSCRMWKIEQQISHSSLEKNKFFFVLFAKILYDLVTTINAHLVKVCLHIQKHKEKTFEGWQSHHFILTWTKSQINISSQMPHGKINNGIPLNLMIFLTKRHLKNIWSFQWWDWRRTRPLPIQHVHCKKTNKYSPPTYIFFKIKVGKGHNDCIDKNSTQVAIVNCVQVSYVTHNLCDDAPLGVFFPKNKTCKKPNNGVNKNSIIIAIFEIAITTISKAACFAMFK